MFFGVFEVNFCCILEAVDIISKYRSAGDSRQACEDLVDEALRKNSFDNVTVVFLSFKWTNAP